MICIGKCVSKNIIIYYLIIMADVIDIFWADVIALFLFKYEIFGRCYANMTMDCH